MDVGSHTRGVRTSSRNVGSRNQHQQPRLPVKLELSSIDSHEDEEDDGESDDDVIMSDEQDHHVLRSLHYDDDKARAADQVKGYLTGDAQDDKIIPIIRPVGTASKPARVSKVSISFVQMRLRTSSLLLCFRFDNSYVEKRRDSTVKRKEQSQSCFESLEMPDETLMFLVHHPRSPLVHQSRLPLTSASPCRHLPYIVTDRIAQRAFRIRKKVYHLELETNAIEAADKIQDMVDSNKRLTKMMERLQKENAAVSPRTKLGGRWSDDVRRGGADERDLFLSSSISSRRPRQRRTYRARLPTLRTRTTGRPRGSNVKSAAPGPSLGVRAWRMPCCLSTRSSLTSSWTTRSYRSTIFSPG
jgi:hypothetical protein